MLTIVTSDNERFTVEDDIALQAGLLGDFASNEDPSRSEQEVPLPNITSAIFRKILDYCEHHRGEPNPSILTEGQPKRRTTKWDDDYIAEADNDELFEIIRTANYLNIKPLLDLGAGHVANMIKGKTPEEVRTIFNIGAATKGASVQATSPSRS